MPEKGIEPSATKVHGLSHTYSTEEKRLVTCKGELKDTVTAKCAASKIVEVVKQVMSGDTPVILVAHNGNSFDHDRLLSFLERNHEARIVRKLSRDFILWRYSLPTIRKLKAKLDLPSWKLSDVYRKFFAEDFAAHEAVADVTPLGRIIFHSSSTTTLQSGIKNMSKSLKFLCGQRVLNTEKSQREKELLRLCGKEEMSKKKLSKLGFYVEILEEFWQSFGPDVFVSFLSGKEPRAGLPTVSKNVKEIVNLIKKLSG